MASPAPAPTTGAPQPDSLAGELAEMSPEVLVDFVRNLTAQLDNMSDLFVEACDREDKAVELAAQWQDSYEKAQRKLDSIAQLLTAEIQGGAR